MGMISIFLITYPEKLAGVFTTDPDTIGEIVETLPMVAVYIIFSGIQGTQSGNVRALAQQLPATITTLCCYYFFGLPLAIYLGFRKNLELYGFWLGFTIALLFLDSIVATIVVQSDWSNRDIGKEDETEEWTLKDTLKHKKDGPMSPLLNSSFHGLTRKDEEMRMVIAFSPTGIYGKTLGGKRNLFGSDVSQDDSFFAVN